MPMASPGQAPQATQMGTQNKSNTSVDEPEGQKIITTIEATKANIGSTQPTGPPMWGFSAVAVVTTANVAPTSMPMVSIISW